MISQRTQLETVMETVVEVDSLAGSPVTSPGGHLYQRDPSRRPQALHLGDVNAMLLEQMFDYKRKLEFAEAKLRKVESKRDAELKVIVSRLLLLEGKLIRDKEIVETTLREKDELIEDLRMQLRRGMIFIDRVDGRLVPADLVGSEETMEMDQQPVHYIRRASTDNGRLLRDMKSYSLPVFCSVECQTEEYIDAFKVVEMPGIVELDRGPKPDVPPRALRSYSNPDDPEENYDKTSDAKVKDKDMMIVNNEMIMNTEEGRRDSVSRIKLPVMRKKSLSSPDLQLMVESEGKKMLIESNNNMADFHQNRESDQHLNNYYDEVDHSIAASLASPRPSLPQITVQGSLSSHPEWRKEFINSQVEHEEYQQSEESPRTRKTSVLTRKSKVYLRSYSTPDVEESLSRKQVDEATTERSSSLKLPKDSMRKCSSESSSYDEGSSPSEAPAGSVYL